MQQHELSRTCDLCDQAIKDVRYDLQACKDNGQSVSLTFHYVLCSPCYQKVTRPIATVLQHMLREETTKLKQELQAA